MEETEAFLKATVHYYCRTRFFRAMQNAAVEGLKKYPNEPVYRFYYGISLVLEGRVQEGIRELDLVSDHHDVMLGSLLALIYAHKKCKAVDREAIAKLEVKLKETRKQAGEDGIYYAGLFLFFTERYDKAKDYVDRLLKMSPLSVKGGILKGWIEVISSEHVVLNNVLSYFEKASGTDPDASLGRVKSYERTGNYMKALEMLNQTVVLFPGFIPALIEKMKIQLALKDWDQMFDAAHRVLNTDRLCVEAQRHLILYYLCWEGNYDQGSGKMLELISSFDSKEPKNAPLYYETARLFSRLCDRYKSILVHTATLVERATTLDPSNAEYATELGYQYLLQGKIREASKSFHSATKMDESSINGLIGIIFCQLLENQLDVAEQQLELLKELHKATGMPSELLFLSGMLAQKSSKRADEVIGYLNESVDAHLVKLKGIPLGLQYFLHLNPDYLVLIAKLYLPYIPDVPVSMGQPVPAVIKRCQSVLQLVTSACPGLLEASYIMARLKFLAGDPGGAKSILQRCLKQDAAYCDAHLLLAQILLHEGNIQSANQSLEVALSYSFEVRERPLYHIIKARIQKQQNALEDSIKTLQTAMTLAGLKPSSGTMRKKLKQDVSTSDKVTLYLELADAHRKLDQQHEAAKVMQDAMSEFQGTPEEIRITIANADLALARGDTELALNVLRSVGPDQAYFLQAREKMAHIYLHQRKDRRLFASCYREVVEKLPTPQSYLLLGDAYMSIQEPERAIEVYEQALKKNPRDGMLARKIGQALIKIHHYEKAVTYYKAAIKTSGQVLMRYDLAHLLYRMRRYIESEDVIKAALESENQSNDLSWMQWEAKFLHLLAQVHLKAERKDQANKTLQRARDVQSRVMRRIPVEQPDVLPEQKKLAVSICCQLAEQAASSKDHNAAVQYYKEALSYDEGNNELLLALAKLEIGANDLDGAQQYCSAVLKSDKENDTATLMLADVMFRKADLEGAMFHFQQLLERKPDYYSALARYIEAVRRLGKLEEVPPLLEKAEQHSPRPSMEAGFHYCKGLYEWYTGNTSSAMKSFNKARNDPEWGLIATFHMIEICVNPDNETLGGETFESVNSNLRPLGFELSAIEVDNLHPVCGQSGQISALMIHFYGFVKEVLCRKSYPWATKNNETGLAERLNSQEAAIKTAEKLLNEIQSKAGNELDYHIMSNFVLLAKKQKGEAEVALNEFMRIVTDEKHRDHIGAILGMATAYMILKQTPRARNQLKRVAKNPWNFGDAEYLEKCWLLLADIYVQSGKFDMATELLKRVLQHNKSCTKAYEYMGYIMEKEQSYKDAAEYYEVSWRQSGQSNPVIGYKLAFNYLKAKRYTDAIDVCRAVLTDFPEYPKIRKDILEKCRANLRT